MERDIELSTRSARLLESTFDESDIGDQLADIFDSVASKLEYQVLSRAEYSRWRRQINSIKYEC